MYMCSLKDPAMQAVSMSCTYRLKGTPCRMVSATELMATTSHHKAYPQTHRASMPPAITNTCPICVIPVCEKIQQAAGIRASRLVIVPQRHLA